MAEREDVMEQQQQQQQLAVGHQSSYSPWYLPTAVVYGTAAHAAADSASSLLSD